MALHHSLIECLFVVLLYLIVSLMKMSYPHKYAYSALSLQADCLSLDTFYSVMFLVLLLSFVPIVLREFQYKDYHSFYATSFLTCF